MPSYQYRCEDGHEFEKTHSIKQCDDEHACSVDGCLKATARVLVPMAASQTIWKCDLWTRDDYSKSGRPIKS